MKVTDFFKCNMLESSLTNNIQQFYRDILKEWFANKEKPTNSRDIRTQVIWYNKYIVIANKTLFNKTAYNMGLCFINDILDRQGKFLNYVEIAK